MHIFLLDIEKLHDYFQRKMCLFKGNGKVILQTLHSFYFVALCIKVKTCTRHKVAKTFPFSELEKIC